MSIALYRRYRPETFQEVIGQSHVTEPLMAALAAGRTTHAYLFSGPRGCGKTTSARILARCLNCVEYPTDTPCGKCDSCVELARDGSGSLDVVELDAASHGGVDDARELREQAGFAPVRDRFKIFIIDEAHMVSNQGFNALLKVVEEPPEHVKFIFATTEPEKVIGTIRSRTHHYPFRLVPPGELEDYLAQICEEEGVSVGRDVLSLAVRAGTGSVRDTLSVLDQLIGGSKDGKVEYETAVALLGYTSASLLDEAIDAISERDGAALFGVVDSIVKSGHDPRRFVEDLLQRLRDLVIISLTGDGAEDVFVTVPDDQYARMREQADALGGRRASRYADLTNEALNKMQGATAPRLQLELLCARLVVDEGPQERAPQSERAGGQAAMPANLDKWKKSAPAGQQAPEAQRVTAQSHDQARQDQVPPAGVPNAAAPDHRSAAEPESAVNPARVAPENRPAPVLHQDDIAAAPAQQQAAPPAQQQSAPASQQQSVPAAQQQSVPAAQQQAAQRAREPQNVASAPQQQNASAAEGASQPASLDVIVSRWSEVVVEIQENGSRVAARQVEQSAGPIALSGSTLTLGFEQPGLAAAFGRHTDHVAQALKRVLGIDLTVTAQVGTDPGTAPKVDAAQDAAPAPRESQLAEEVPATAPSHAESAAPHTEPVAPHAESAAPHAESAAPHGESYDQVPEDPYADLDEPEAPELDPIYGYQTDEASDPAGVLGPLVDGTAVFVGDDNVVAPTAVAPEEPAWVAPEVPAATVEQSEPAEPFYAQDMPTVPPRERPNPPRERPEVHAAAQPGPQSAAQPAAQPDEYAAPKPGASPVAQPPEPTQAQPVRAADFVVPPASFPSAATPAGNGGNSTSGFGDRVAQVRSAASAERATEQAPAPAKSPVTLDDWDEVSADDPEITTSGQAGLAVVIDHFNAQIIDEFNHEDGK